MTTGIRAVLTEIESALGQIDAEQYTSFVAALRNTSGNVFVTGQGRSGLVAQMAAMRLMHLGLPAHAVGEVTAPSIHRGDLLIIVSGSGRTPISEAFARIARDEGASVALITKDDTVPLTRDADTVLQVAGARSRQFAGSLFEQSALLVFDAIVMDITGGSPASYEQMQKRHTNLQ
jgi:6-phospho-3-hexuloisomerase